MIDEVTYFSGLHARRNQAVDVVRREVNFADGALPQAAACHANVDRWVSENPGNRAARGWVIITNFGTSLLLAAHSVVASEDGDLTDITPLPPQSTPFLPHLGSETEFKTLAARWPTVTFPPIQLPGGAYSVEIFANRGGR